MSTAMNFGNKSFTPRPPDKGAFPLDHLGTQIETGRGHCLDIVIPGECKKFKEVFMECLKDNRYDSSMCRMQSKNYLECRMERQLMAKEPLQKLGFKDLLNQSGEDPKH